MKYLLTLLLFSVSLLASPQVVWIDADSANETDDVYAILRLLTEKKIEVVGLSSAHFNNPDLVVFDHWNQYETNGINTVKLSQEVNEVLLEAVGRSELPHPLGADRQMGRSWGENEARPSAASQGIIDAVKKLPASEKLHVVALGAVTNIASALKLEPSIAPRVICHVLAGSYTFEKKAFNKNEFNVRNDLNAFDYLLDTPSIELEIMPTNVALPFQFHREPLFARLDDHNRGQKFLKQRWMETNPESDIRILWDLALVEAFLNPEFCCITEVPAPAENAREKIRIYSGLDVSKATDDFLQSLAKPFH